MRVRFLKVKRFPHPDGPKRQPGEVVRMDAELAEAWQAAGLLEPAQSKPAAEPEPKPATDSKPKGKNTKK